MVVAQGVGEGSPEWAAKRASAAAVARKERAASRIRAMARTTEERG